MSELEWNQSVRFALVRILDVVGAAAIRVGRDEVFEVDASFENGVAALNKWGLHIRKEDGKDNTEQFGRHGTCQALMALMLGNCVLRQRTQAPTHYDKFIVGGLHWLLATHNSKAEDHVAKRVSDYNKTFKLAHIALTLNTGINQPAPFAQVRKVINRTLIKGGKNCKWAWSLSGKGEPQLLPTLIALRALCSEPNYLVENKEDIKSALFWVLETCKSDPNNDVNVAALLQTCAMLPLLLKQPFFADLIHALHEVFRQNQPATGQQGDVFIHYYDWKVKNRPLSIQYCRMPLWLMDTAYRLERYLEFGGNEAERIDLTSRLSGLLATTNHQWVEKFQLVEPYAWLARIFAACSQVGAYKCLFNSQAALAIQQSVKLPTALSIGHLAIECVFRRS